VTFAPDSLSPRNRALLPGVEALERFSERRKGGTASRKRDGEYTGGHPPAWGGRNRPTR
jgi:hypothetical protein